MQRSSRLPPPRRPARRGTPRPVAALAASLTTAALLAACAALGVAPAGAALAASPSPAQRADSLPPAAWRPMPCPTCARSRIAIDTRRSIAPAGRDGAHAFARVRNENPYPVALVASFVPDHSANSEGAVRAEYWTLQLGAAGTGAGGERRHAATAVGARGRGARRRAVLRRGGRRPPPPWSIAGSASAGPSARPRPRTRRARGPGETRPARPSVAP
jgi:hypothetical protein